MCTLEIIEKLLIDKKKQQIDLAKFLGVSKQTLSNWLHGGNSGYTKHLNKIAEFFNVSVDYLLGREENKKNTVGDDDQLQQLNFIFIRLNDDGRAKLLEQAVMMEKSGLYNDDSKIVKIAARTGHTTSAAVDNPEDYPDAPDTI